MDNNSQLAQPSSITQSRPPVGQVANGNGSSGGSGGGFDAGQIEPLEYNLRPYVDSSGVVPEPTRARQSAFNKRITKVGNTANISEIRGLEPEEQQRAVEKDPALIDRMLEAGDEAEEEIRAAVADLCNGQPSREEIDQLPPRVFTAFYQWVLASLTPEV